MAIRSDDPITDESEDRLGRARLAEVVASEIREVDASHGFVVGILGPWGSGKTSFINLIQNRLLDEPKWEILSFNPWMFSGSQHLVQSFFEELAAQLRLGPSKLQKIADKLDNYGKRIAPMKMLPGLGPWIETFSSGAKAVKTLADAPNAGVETKRKELSVALAQLETPILVVIDDIDRLRKEEVQEIFQLVRLTGNFPNLVYLVAFDRDRVEAALEQEGFPGRDYLEKIVQVGYDVPEIPYSLLTKETSELLSNALDDIVDLAESDRERLQSVFLEVVRPLIRNMRGLRRYAASLRATVKAMDGKVDPIDLLAAEAIRVFQPDVFREVINHRTALSARKEVRLPFQDIREGKKSSVSAVLNAATSESRDAVLAFVRAVFPVGYSYLSDRSNGLEDEDSWLANGRLAHIENLNLYLERFPGQTLETLWKYQNIVQISTDYGALLKYVSLATDEELENVTWAVDSLKHELPDGAEAITSSVLLNMVDSIPAKVRTLFDVDPERLVEQIVRYLLGRISDKNSRIAMVQTAMNLIDTMSRKLTLLEVMTENQDIGRSLLSVEESSRLSLELRQELFESTPEMLLREPLLGRVILWYRKTRTVDEPEFQIPNDHKVECHLVSQLTGESWTYSYNTGLTETAPRFDWRGALELFGREESTLEIVRRCRHVIHDTLFDSSLQAIRQELGIR